ncbi:tRNA (adenosine(37)-N6)-dimethylallyltransferase MiaA [Pseudobacter ginsenosidimutans]|uniref:tRNA dimethylallyltransferase n=1 Tax=Pseudobacter ginsenosidimutans TaxID=661488 RepID=A0A4Q7MYN3_9BACT|nr:tRNA (adenosine(37)-N6)-dimethylallyltransferase MiaA [Pseudobacter ginsenosidimutans]QEC42996.1 tRNA (adenosine(37)-N6)-dimethylallyltransferase MiaA [Pseudobacter ginsenosidimutans]RZS74347.1 tRNA dimethylallyltransferase [Pseudobacter ginsenosidimutans]
MANKTVIIIGGPTASGKTALAIRLAQYFNTNIISADSRQCYREMTIGVAKPSEEELQLVKHYFINSHSIHQGVTAATFEQYALEASKEIFSEKDIAVMVGGTGLYIKAFCEGLDDIPAIDPAIREQINADYAQHGLVWLQQQVATLDPIYYSNGEILNPQRLIRALEVKLHTGRSIREFQQKKNITRDFDTIKLSLELPKEILHQRIHLRVDQMMEQGLLAEVQSLHPYKDLNALRTVGYAELFNYIDSKGTLENAVEAIKSNTRYYAKRQMTWFKKDKAFQWFSPGEEEAILEMLHREIK